MSSNPTAPTKKQTSAFWRFFCFLLALLFDACLGVLSARRFYQGSVTVFGIDFCGACRAVSEQFLDLDHISFICFVGPTLSLRLRN